MMSNRSRGLTAMTALVALAAALSACVQVPTAPSVQAMAGPRKSAAAFMQDNSYCTGLAAASVSGAQKQMNQQQSAQILSDDSGMALQNAAATAAQGNATLQQQYDYMFGQCMISRGNLVAGMMAPIGQDYAPATRTTNSDPLVRSIQSELVRTGFLRGGVDGVYGPGTRSAILSFESANNLASDPDPSSGLLSRLRGAPSGHYAAPATSVSLVQPVTGAAGGRAAPATGSGGLVAPVTSPAAASSGGAAAASGGLVAPVTQSGGGAAPSGGGLVAPVTTGAGK
jgi:peptidoglycan hydrolase-like protein with peptidoglycan-binding domain